MSSFKPLMTSTAPPTSSTLTRSKLLQRECACGGTPGPTGECEECRNKRLQRKIANPKSKIRDEPVVPPILHEVLSSPGESLDAKTRAFMEPRFNHDFSAVRVHTDARAAESAQAVNALAYAIGSHLVFGTNQFAPGTPAGRRLLAHELAHTIQQTGAEPAGAEFKIAPAQSASETEADAISDKIVSGSDAGVVETAGAAVQRDLATPEPEVSPEAQPDLTDAQIREAIRFNSQLYDEANTRLIQNILGGPVTGRWTSDNIRAIAATQERFGLKKDGKVGSDTFRFIVGEQGLEGMGTETENCLTAFRVVFHPVETASTVGPGGTTRIRGHHVVEAQFSSRCNCSEFQYRQFIAGVATGSRGGTIRDLSTLFSNIPGGSLPLAMQEDGNTTCPARNYGHREQSAQDRTTTGCGENRYKDDKGATDQANGCFYRGEDFPQTSVTGLNSGDVVDLLVQFRGEIQRNGRTIETKNWTDIDTSATTP